MSTATLNGAPSATSLFAGKATEGGGSDKYDLCPAGNHPGRLVSIFDLGTHDDEYEGQAKPDQRMFLLAWELPTVNRPNGEPFVIGETYTTFVNKDGDFEFGVKNKLRLMLEGWRGKKYAADENIDPAAVLGRACLVNVIHKKTKKGNDIAIVDGVKGFPQGMQAPAARHESVVYHVSMGEPPSVPWLPKVYFRESGKMEFADDVARFSKELTGRPIGKSGPKDTPYSEASRPEAAPTTDLEDSEIPF